MNSFPDEIKSALAQVFQGDSASEWEVYPDGTDSCIMMAPQCRVSFFLDPRNQLVSSNIKFLEEDIENKDELPSHIIARLFRNIVWHEQLEIHDVRRRVVAEMDNIKNILREMKERDVSPRDLLYFYFGYNRGYTDYINRA